MEINSKNIELISAKDLKAGDVFTFVSPDNYGPRNNTTGDPLCCWYVYKYLNVYQSLDDRKNTRTLYNIDKVYKCTKQMDPQMKSWGHQNRVDLFMIKGGQNLSCTPVVPAPEVRLLRARLILEEALEAIDAMGIDVSLNETMIRNIKDLTFADSKREVSLVEVAKELSDVSVVNTGTFSAFGIDMEPILLLVDENNYLKVKDGVVRDEHGKIMKNNVPSVREAIKKELDDQA